MDIPTIRKEFILEIEIKKHLFGFLPFKRKISGMFKQPTAMEMHNYFKSGSKFTLKFIKDLFFEHTNIKKGEFKYIMMKLDDVTKFLEGTYFEGLGEGGETERMPFNSDIMWLANNDPEKYYRILNNLTIPQIQHLFDCKIWNINSETKEGQKRNDGIRRNRPEVQLEYDRKFKELDKALQSKK